MAAGRRSQSRRAELHRRARSSRPQFYPSEAGLGYVGARAQGQRGGGVALRSRARRRPAYAPALAGRGEALLALGQREQALASFEAAVAADPKLRRCAAASRCCASAGMQDDVDAARKAAEAGRLAEARGDVRADASPRRPRARSSIASWPTSNGATGNLDAALEHAQKAAELEPDRAAELRRRSARSTRRRGTSPRRPRRISAALALEPSDALDGQDRRAPREARRSRRCRPSTARSRPSPTVTRAQLAALSACGSTTCSSARRGDNAGRDHRHARQLGRAVDPGGRPRRRDGGLPEPHLPAGRGRPARRSGAGRVSRVLALIADGNAAARPPRGGTRAAQFPDVPPGHLSYPAASLAVEPA